MYDLFKALHLFFMVAWFAGLFYLPRLFVYHAEAKDSVGIERFKIMERKLFWGIMTPSGVLTIFFGFYTISAAPYPWEVIGQSWLQLKIATVALLLGYHLWCFNLVRRFKAGGNTRSHIWYRWFNEIPTLLLLVIVLLAVFKP